MTLVEAKGLRKRFGDFTAVDDISFSVARGEVAGFLGPNGAGKSTTMKMLAGFLEPDSGQALIGGHDVQSDPIAAREMLGYLPEGAPAYGDMSVADFLHFIGRMRGLSGSRLRERLAEMVERVEISDVWNRPIDNLSKGFKRRVGIAQSLLHDPDVLVLDEPTDGLDPNQKHEMRALIRSIAAQKAIIISTHILEEVEAICTRVMIIANGRMMVDNTPAALVAGDGQTMRTQIVIARADTESGTARLLAIDGVSAVDSVGTHAEWSTLALSGTPQMPSPRELAEHLDAQGIRVESMARLTPSLEDVFRQMTRGG